MLAYQPRITSLHLESPIPVPFSAIGIDQPSVALNLTVTAGSLTGLDDQTIAVGSSWRLAGAILAGCAVIAVLTSALPAWFQLRPRRRPPGWRVRPR
jgi:hypothetical protein